MVPAPITAACLICALAYRPAHRHFAGHALGEEGVAQRFRFGGLHQMQEALALEFQAIFEFAGDGSGHRFHALERRREGPAMAFDGIARELQESFVIRIIDLALAHFRQRTRIGHFLGKGDGLREQIGTGLVDRIEQGRASQLFRRNRRAGYDHVQRHFQPQHARQTLGAASTRQQAQLHFRQRDLGARQRTR
jgi:hypothetical protein